MTKLPKWVNFFRPAPLKAKTQIIYKRTKRIAQKKPLTFFFATLALLLTLIAIGNYSSKPKTTADVAKEPIEVQTFAIGSAPKITVPAQIEKEGVIQIAAQTSGIVNKINFREGQKATKGQTLIALASNYQGANAASLQRQLAAIQAQSASVTYNGQIDIIGKQREIANETSSNSNELREITQKSVSETKSQVNLNESILTTVESNLKILESTNVGGTNDALILQTKQLQSQFLATTNQARSALRSAEFQADTNKPPSALASLTKEATIKQLDLQEKTLKLGVEAANLQTKLAKINESLFFPTAPFTSTVEKIHVRIGQQVAPGTLLATITSSNKSQTAVAYVPQSIASSISKLNPSYLILDNDKLEVAPIYISREAVIGQLYAIIFPIPETASNRLTDKGIVDVQIPIGYSFTSSSVPYVPLDAVHQTQDKATIFVEAGGKAEGKIVTLGLVQGNFIEITSGLNSSDIVITSRNIVSGDPVKAKTP